MEWPKKIYLGILLISGGVLLSGVFIEQYFFVEPCPLCLLQRGVYIGLCVVSLVGLVGYHKRIIRVFCTSATFLLAITGIFLAGRQIWLQHLPPDKVPSCTAGLQRLIESYPLLDVLTLALKGTGDCARVDFTILGWSLANWSILIFSSIVLAAIMLVQGKRSGN